MTLVVADTHEQARFWATYFHVEDWKYVRYIHDVVGFPRETEVIAVGSLESRFCRDLVQELRERRFIVAFPKGC